MRRSKSRPHKDRQRHNRQDPRYIRKRAAAERLVGQDNTLERAQLKHKSRIVAEDPEDDETADTPLDDSTV